VSSIRIDEITFQYRGQQNCQGGVFEVESLLTVWFGDYYCVDEVHLSGRDNLKPWELFYIHLNFAAVTLNRYFGYLRRKFLMGVLDEYELDCLKTLYPGDLEELKP